MSGKKDVVCVFICVCVCVCVCIAIHMCRVCGYVRCVHVCRDIYLIKIKYIPIRIMKYLKYLCKRSCNKLRIQFCQLIAQVWFYTQVELCLYTQDKTNRSVCKSKPWHPPHTRVLWFTRKYSFECFDSHTNIHLSALIHTQTFIWVTLIHTQTFIWVLWFTHKHSSECSDSHTQTFIWVLWYIKNIHPKQHPPSLLAGADSANGDSASGSS